MGSLLLEGFAGKLKYAQLLNDASEIKFSESSKRHLEEAAAYSLQLRLPVRKPDVTVPVIELFLK